MVTGPKPQWRPTQQTDRSKRRQLRQRMHKQSEWRLSTLSSWIRVATVPLRLCVPLAERRIRRANIEMGTAAKAWDVLASQQSRRIDAGRLFGVISRSTP